MHHRREGEGEGRTSPAGSEEFDVDGSVAVRFGNAQIAAVAAQDPPQVAQLCSALPRQRGGPVLGRRSTSLDA